MKIVVNKCFGGFGLSDFAYEELIKLGVPVCKYTEEVRGEDGRFKDEPKNEGEIIFDRTLSLGEGVLNDARSIKFLGRYWEMWISQNRTHPLLIKVVERLGKKSWGMHAELEVVEIPDGIEWEISDYDGIETIHEKHRSW